MRHISTLSSSIALGSAGVLMMSVLSGCSSQEQEKAQNKFLVIEQQPNGKYVVVEEMPTEGPSRAIIREKDAQGNVTERFMNEAEMKALAEQEYKKVENGTSETTQASSGEGMGLAGTILAVAAGSLMGNMIANSLMNNSNFKSRANSVNKSAYHRSKSGAGYKGSTTGKKSFFGGSTTGKKSYSGGSYGG